MTPSPVFVFCALRLVLDGTEGVRFSFHVLRSRTLFRRNGKSRVPYSCFALPDPFWAVPWVLGPVFLFCVAGFVWGGTERVRSHFYVLRSCTSFRRYQGRRVPFSCFVLSDSFWDVPKASGPIYKFCAPRHVLTAGACDHRNLQELTISKNP
jgi:hypothetical protein